MARHRRAVAASFMALTMLVSAPPSSWAAQAHPSKGTSSVSRWRRWVDRRFLGVGAGSGFLGGICCVGGAVAVGLGVSGLSFFGVWMERYQIYFIAGSAALMLLWLARVARPYGFTREGILGGGRVLGRHALIMGIIYAATLGLTVGASLLFQRP